MAIDAANNLYFTTFHTILSATLRTRIRVINLSGVPTTYYPGSSAPLTVQSKHIATIAGGGTNLLANGTAALPVIGSASAIDTAAIGTFGFDFDLNWPAGGFLYFTEFFQPGSRIRRISASMGIVNTISGGEKSGFGGENVAPEDSSVKWNLPNGLRIDRTNNFIYIADSGNNRIRKIDLTMEKVTTAAGSGFVGASGEDALSYTASLGLPNSVRFAKEPLLVPPGDPTFFVADLENNRIAGVEPGGKLNRIAGQGTAGFMDGNAAMVALLNAPTDLAVQGPLGPAGGEGNLYVTEAFNHVIRYINRAAIPVTVGTVGVPAGQTMVVVGQAEMSGTFPVKVGDEADPLNVLLNIPESVETAVVGGKEVLFIVARFGLRMLVFNPNGVSVDVMGQTVNAGKVRVVATGIRPGKIRVDVPKGSVWVTNFAEDRVLRFNLATGVLVESFSPIGRPYGLGIGPQVEAYVGATQGQQLFKLQPNT